MTTTTAFDWTEVAASWDSHRAHVEQMKEPITAELLAQLRLQPGQRVLELGAGTGELALRLAAAVGPTGHVIASDAAAGMVALLERTVAGTPTIEALQLDASRIDLPDASADAVVCRMGMMFVENPADALRECRRVLVPGGRLAVAVWAGPAENPWVAYVGMAAMMNGLVQGGPPTGPGGIFSLADPTALEATAGEAGFTDIVVGEVDIESRFASSDEHFDTVSSLAGPLSAAIAAASDGTRTAMRATVAGLDEPHRTPDGLVLPGRALVCTARA
jgi:SAM-dependent methyltransferase